MRSVNLTLAVLFSGLLLAQSLPMDASWQAADYNFDPLPTGTNGASVWFDFPTDSNSWATKLGRATKKALPLTGTALTARFEIIVTGAPTFRWDSETFNTCYGIPATVRPMITNTTKLNELGRWWSNQIAATLGPGPFQLSVPLQPAFWSDAQGHPATQDVQHQNAFASVLSGTREVRLDFGGGCFYNHGVRVENGTARFTLTNYEVF